MSAKFVTRQQSELSWNTVWDGYCSELERDPDRSAFSYMWELQSGNMSKGQFITALQNSAEYKELHKPVDPPPIEPEPPDATPVTRRVELYHKMFYVEGTPWRWKGVSAFKAYQHWLLHRDQLGAFLTDLRRISNTDFVLRVFGMYNGGIGRFLPQEHPNYYEQLRPFAEHLAALGFRMEFVIFADRQNIMPQDVPATAHAQKIYTALEGVPNVLIEWMNEPWKNGDFFAYINRKNITSARGSGQDAEIIKPVLDYITNHSPRDDEWPRKAKNCYEDSELAGVPSVADEPMGLAEIDIPGSRSSSISDFGDYFNVASLLANGGTIHGTFGVETRPLTPKEEEIFRAALKPMETIPAPPMLWEYTRNGFSTMPIEFADTWGLRAYGRTTGMEAYVTIVRPTASFGFIPKPGWTGTEIAPHVYHLTRT